MALQRSVQFRDKHACHSCDSTRSAKRRQLGHRQPFEAAGVDPAERAEIHVDIDGCPMITRPAADPYTDARQFGALHIHPRGTRPGGRDDAESGGGGDHRLFQGGDQIAHAKACTAQVDERIDHELPRAVVGDMPAAIDLHHRDVTRREQVSALMDRALEAYGSLDIVVANAGIIHNTPFLELDDATFDRVIAVNVRGVWLGLKHTLPEIARRGGGSIVITASTAGIRAVPGIAPYICSKHAVIASPPGPPPPPRLHHYHQPSNYPAATPPSKNSMPGCKPRGVSTYLPRPWPCA